MVRARPIFLVDDDAGSQLLIAHALIDAGLTNPTEGFLDGALAMSELLARSSGSGASHLPALVFLDWHMPNCSGIEVLAQMRSTVGLERVPVIMLSACDHARNVNEAYRLGASSYLIKPLAFSALRGVVRNLTLPWQLT